MTVAVNSNTGRGFMTIDIAGWATAAGCLGSIANPEGVPLAILRAYLYVATPSALAAVLDIGVGALAADSVDVLNALSLAQTAGTLWVCVDLDVASKSGWTTPAIWTATTYLNFTTATYVSTAFRGQLFLEYLRLT
jgi:hypothetical protein